MNNNVDLNELEKFSQHAHQWWDKNGEFRTLHEINPLRLEYINAHVPISGKRVLDLGCGGGILSESMATSGALVTGIDLAQKSIKIAQLHGIEIGSKVDYRCIAAEELAQELAESFDVIACMEMLEHVPNPQSIINAIGKLLRPDGWVFFSTINRNLKSYFKVIIGAEYVLKLLAKGTHSYQRFIKPSELSSMAQNVGLNVVDIRGINYQVFKHQASLSADVSSNYIMALRNY